MSSIGEKELRRLIQLRLIAEAADPRFEYEDAEVVDLAHFAQLNELAPEIFAAALEASYAMLDNDVKVAWSKMTDMSIVLAEKDHPDMAAYIKAVKNIQNLGTKPAGTKQDLDQEIFDGHWRKADANIFNANLLKGIGEKTVNKVTKAYHVETGPLREITNPAAAKSPTPEGLGHFIMQNYTSPKDGDIQEYVAAGLYSLINPSKNSWVYSCGPTWDGCVNRR